MPPRFRVPAQRFTLSDTARAEAFSDGVFAIALTLLVLGLTTPAHPPGGLGDALARQWPAYLGYAASFSYIAVIWLNHHRAFLRIRSMDRGLHAANLFLLFTTAALAFPTEVVATELQADAWGTDAKVAVALYAALAAAMCLSWAALYHRLQPAPRAAGKHHRAHLCTPRLASLVDRSAGLRPRRSPGRPRHTAGRPGRVRPAPHLLLHHQRRAAGEPGHVR